ncbi:MULTISPECIES: DUF4253 domain-containing protein [unclassified Streptomyces]|uniref:DUF4253 domain-containing protein n=1 Tax=unclassified Streptomyces TaxID=2593676 RepID=UPI0033A47BD9
MATLPNPLPRLTTDPSGRSLGLRLPPGRLIGSSDEDPSDEPVLWHSDKAAAPGNWTVLGGQAGRTGLLPVLVDVGGGGGGPQKWGLMPGEASYPGDHDAEDVLADFWEVDEEEDEGYWDDETAEMLAPFGPDWPGLAPSPSLTIDPAVCAAQVADRLTDGTRSWPVEPRLALVPARRSADVPAALGWSGPLNHTNDVALLCAVLRSWEDRFGIRVVALGFDLLVVSVAAPPTTTEAAEAVAAEHFAFCPDNITQGPGSLRAYAEQLVGERAWHFWWD